MKIKVNVKEKEDQMARNSDFAIMSARLFISTVVLCSAVATILTTAACADPQIDTMLIEYEAAMTAISSAIEENDDSRLLKALSHLSELERDQPLSDEHQIILNDRLSDIFSLSGRHSQAIERGIAAVEIARKAGPKLEISMLAMAHASLGTSYERASDYSLALAEFAHAHELLLDEHQPSELISDILDNGLAELRLSFALKLSQMMIVASHYSEAEEVLIGALGFFDQCIESDLVKGPLIYNLGALLYQTRASNELSQYNLPEAISHVESGLNIFGDMDSEVPRIDEASLYLTRAHTHNRMANWELALRDCRSAEELIDANDSEEGRFRSGLLLAEAEAMCLKGDFREQGRLIFEARAVVIGENRSSDFRLFQIDNEIGEWYSGQGLYGDAISPLTEAKHGIEGLSLDQTSLYAAILNNLATAKLHIDSREGCEELFIRSLELRERLFGADHFQTGKTLLNFSPYYMKPGRYDLSRNLIERAISIFESYPHCDPGYLDTAKSTLKAIDRAEY